MDWLVRLLIFGLVYAFFYKGYEDDRKREPKTFLRINIALAIIFIALLGLSMLGYI